MYKGRPFRHTEEGRADHASTREKREWTKLVTKDPVLYDSVHGKCPAGQMHRYRK